MNKIWYFTSYLIPTANCKIANGNDGASDLDFLNSLRCQKSNRILIGHININSLMNKIEIIVFNSS